MIFANLDPMHRVLFVCAGNTCRSPMAEALARRLLGAPTHFESAGVDAGDGAPATKDAVRAMKERGLDISAHRSRPLSGFDLLSFDLLIALTPGIAQTLRKQGVPVSKIRALNIPDPYCKGLDSYRTTADAIERGLRELFRGVSENTGAKS